MATDVTFVFTVICPIKEDHECNFLTGDSLQRFHDKRKQIRDDLKSDNRAKDAHLLSLEELNVYAGQLLRKGQDVNGIPLETGQIPGELTAGTRYGHPLFVGVAKGRDIFTESLEDLENSIVGANGDDQAIADSHINMRKWQVRFNYLLHESFGWKEVGHLPYIPIDEAYMKAAHPKKFKPGVSFEDDESQRIFYHESGFEHPWTAAWTIFVVNRGEDDIVPYVMSGSGGC